MAGLPKSGVSLVAEGAPAFFGTMEDANRSVAAFGQGSERAGRSVAEFGSNAARAADRIDTLTDRVALQKRQLGILEQELSATAAKYGASSIQAQKKQLAIDRLTNSIEANQREIRTLSSALDAEQKDLDQAGRAASRFNDITRGAFERVGHAAVDFAMQAGRAIVGFIGDTLSMASSYEQSMNVLQVQSGATAEQMDQVGATARALGADLELPATSAADAAEVMLELSKGGLEVDQAMAAAKGTLQLAAAAETDLATAANITTGALAAFGLEGERAGYIADVLANSANLSRASIIDMSQGFQQAAFRFRSAGQGADDLAASLVILTKNGLSGSDAGTALQNMLARLQGPTAKAAKLMASLGINVYDAAGNMRPMPEIIGIFNEKLGGMTQQERNAALSTILLSDGMKAMIPLLAAGTDGFIETRDAVNEQGSAAALAAAQMKGMGGATKGLVSQLETLALEGLLPLLPLFTSVLQSAAKFAGSFSGQVGPAVEGVIGFFGDVAAVVKDNAIPALVTLGVVTMAYAVTQLPILVAAIGKAVVAFGAQALATAAAVAPFALLGVAIFGVVKAFQSYHDSIRSATDRLLESKTWWTDSTAAIERYGSATGEAAEKLKPYAATIQAIRDQIKGEVEELARRDNAGYLSDAQRQVELDRINQHTIGLRQAEAAYTAEEQALIRTMAASATATNQLAVLENAEQSIITKTELTAAEFEELAKQMEETFQRGGQAVGAYVETEVGFLASLETSRAEHEERIRALHAEKQQAQTDEQRAQIDERIANEEEAYTTSQQNAAIAYAEQQAAQRAHLGSMLSEYALTQVQMGNITNEQGEAILGEIERRFGIQEDMSARTFLEMTGHIDEFAASGSSDVAAFGEDLSGLADDAVETKQKMDELAKEYTATLIQNFEDGKIDADQLADALKKIPAKVYSEVTIHTRRTSSGDGPENNRGQYDEFASGGRVFGGRPIVVGERGRELFVPEMDGMILNASTTRKVLDMWAGARTVSPPAGPSQIQRLITNTYQQRTNQYNYAPTYAAAPRAPSVDFASMAAFGV